MVVWQVIILILLYKILYTRSWCSVSVELDDYIANFLCKFKGKVERPCSEGVI